jgi:hypothetical protein
MAMQTDVKTTKPLTATGVFKTQANADITFRTRIKGIYYTNGASAGSVTITDGNGGTTLITIDTPAAANADGVYILVPDQGLLAENGLYGTVVNTASITLFYG